MKQKIVFSENLESYLQQAIKKCSPDRLFVLTDTTTKESCLPIVSEMACMRSARNITIASGDTNKTLDAVVHVWKCLQRDGATRHSLLINLGGGMVTDLGGFAASTFKRGIAFINIPTTLLAMVDASVGGKTGINFGGLKNEIGAFSDARSVIIDTRFLVTLDDENIRSGYAEMLKHSLISDEPMWASHLQFSFSKLRSEEALQILKKLVAQSVATKERIVNEDPHEKGLRKALNLGHTFGHAIESWSFNNEISNEKDEGNGKGKRERTPLLHGYAVAYGLICELYLSALKCGFPAGRLRQTLHFIRENYGTPAITCDDYTELLNLMRHDKKNTASTINLTLLANIGELRLNQTATDEDICDALDFLREG